jgi:hypothetical protein
VRGHTSTRAGVPVRLAAMVAAAFRARQCRLSAGLPDAERGTPETAIQPNSENCSSDPLAPTSASISSGRLGRIDSTGEG